MNRLLIGIDTGVNTGFAKSFNGDLIDITSTSIIEAMEHVEQCQSSIKTAAIPTTLIVYIEDARLRKWVTGGHEKKQGVGSVKRDASVWQEFCEYHKIGYKLVAPKDNKTKLTTKQFKQYTGWTRRTNQHGRDAGMLIFGK